MGDGAAPAVAGSAALATSCDCANSEPVTNATNAEIAKQFLFMAASDVIGAQSRAFAATVDAVLFLFRFRGRLLRPGAIADEVAVCCRRGLKIN
jgi:hypothetical protein